MATTTTSAAMTSRLKTAIGNRPWTVIAATAFLGATGYQKYKAQERLTKDAKKKKVLVLPFHRMKIVEEKKSPFGSLVDKLANNTIEADSEKVIEMQADELVSLIHEAALDPSIVSLYGIFGNGGAISTGGWAHLEEIRAALELFAKPSSLQEYALSDTDSDSDSDATTTTIPRGKAMYAYSNTFGGQQSMKEYYLASVFPQIHLQPQGDLNLYGLHATSTFYRGFLKKYGITVNVWKHGAYKNMANMFTHSNYSKEHYENTARILLPIHTHVRKAIYASRHKQFKKYGYDFDKFWSMIENAGSFPADVAHELGFVDHLPLKNPLNNLVKNNKPLKKVVLTEGTVKVDPITDASSTTTTTKTETSDDEDGIVTNDHTNDIETNRSSVGDRWKLKTDPDSFAADSQITIDAYARQKGDRLRKEAEGWNLFQKLRKASESNIVAEQLLSLAGYSAPYFNIDESKYSEEKANGLEEKIAIIKINGAIGETVARKAEKALQKVKDRNDVKCVILRVDSPGGSINACESLYQEIQDIPQKVVVSFGNVSASGGYYISSSADQIFASSSTITGSIGVVMVRMDFKELARQYGITFDSVATSALSGSNDPFYPVNRQMSENFGNQADRSYHHFKSLVSGGRNMTMKAVEAIAKGRVYTGEQAREIGLVDHVGGLEEAVSFAQQNYTSSGGAKVVQWPPKRSFWEFLTTRGQKGEDDANDISDVDLPDVFHVVLGGGLSSILGRSASAGIDKSNFLLKSASFSPPSIPVTSGIMLTVDENTAIQCMLEDANVSEEMLAWSSTI